MAVISLWRNRWLSLAAILVMVLTLFTISFFGSLLVVINQATDSLHDKVDIAVFFNDDASKDQIYAMQNQLAGRSDVKQVTYVSKDEALARWRSQNQNNDKVRDIINETYNPLPISLEIKGNRPEDLEPIYNFVNGDDYKPMIREISYVKNKIIIDRLIAITSLVKKIGWILSALFTLISILIIYNTIRLTIYARQDEIGIMRLVGASDWYVQGPFFIEGVAYGLIAAIGGSVLLYLAFRLTFPTVVNYLGVGGALSLFSGLKFWYLIFAQVIAGSILGTVCSLFAVKKYLR